ncbi:hypothetical protein PENSUB_13870 [Penicillium subrubescens]|uniref:Uncharacterized protein n=1 Tax=Penicillium subrubescens TaxID=1316194 RepID=A0A1Q5SMY2_9EURO|nr:hypothetical protein PENSUB_13870 [Penicillium subrubescens]
MRRGTSRFRRKGEVDLQYTSSYGARNNIKTSLIRQVGSEDMDDRYSNAVGDEKSALQFAQNKSGNQLIHSVLEHDAALFWARICQSCEHRRVRAV